MTIPIIRYDSGSVRRSIVTELRATEQSFLYGPAAAVMGSGFLGRLSAIIDEFQHRIDRPLVVAVTGQFKSGKSTLVNALLGDRIVGMDVTPETVLVTQLQEGVTRRARLEMPDGGEVELDPSHLDRASIDTVLRELPMAPVSLRLEAPLALLKGLRIVDTPGLGDALWRSDGRVATWLPHADVVLHVVQAISPLSESERSFLTLSLRPIELSKVIFFVNGLDRLPNAQDAQRVIQRVARLVAPQFPDSPVFGGSALAALGPEIGDAPVAPGRTTELDAGMAALREHLGQLFDLDRDLVRTERAAAGAIQGILTLSGGLESLRSLLEHDSATLLAEVDCRRAAIASRTMSDAVRAKEVEDQVNLLGEEAAEWVGGFIDRLAIDVLPRLHEVHHELVQVHFPFFIAEQLKLAVTTAVEAQRPAIVEIMGASIEGLKSPDPRMLDEALARSTHFAPDWSPIDHIHLVGSLLPGAFGLVGKVVGGILDNQRGLAERAATYRQHIESSIVGLRTGAMELVRDAFGALSRQLAANLLDRAQIAAQEDERVLAQAINTLGLGAERMAQDRKEIDFARQALRQSVDRLERIRQTVVG